MKQSTKLLSIVLALVMCFGCFSVVGNAALVKSQVHYDSIDNAALTAEQAADVLLDYVDSILPNDEVDLSVLGTLHLDTLNQLIPDVYDLLNSFTASIAGGDVAKLRTNRNLLKGWNRTGNNIAAVQKLLQFLGSADVRGVVAKAPYGLLTNNGIKVGSLINGIVAGLVNLDDINDILTDLPGFLTKIVFDALLYGSYPYQGARYDYEDSAWTGLPTEANNIDKIINVAAQNILTKPQDYSWKNINDTDSKGVRYGDYTTAMGKGEVNKEGTQVKIWDMNSVISKTFDGSIDITAKSFFQVLDTLLPYAYNEFGIHGLNHTLKKIMMEAMGVDFIEVAYDKLPAAAQSAFGTEVAASYCNYAMKDLIYKDASDLWYYTDVRSRAVDLNNDGEDDTDEEGNVIKEKTRVYFVADPTQGNDLMDLLDWDYAFDGTSFGTADTASGISSTISTYGSLFGSLNHLLFLILDIAGNDDVIKKDAETNTIKDAAGNVVWTDGDSSKLNANLLAAVKFTLKNFSATIFGKDNAYVDANGNVKAKFLEQVETGDIIDLVAYIGLPLFNDAMPQLIMPKNADGSFAFHDGNQVFEFGVLVIREFLTDIAPAINYDSEIFSVLPSAGSRQFKTHTNKQWYNILLNMGLDLAYTFLNGYTNFNTAIPVKGDNFVDEDTRWKGMLTAIATWGVNYIGKGDSSALAKLAPNTVTAKGNGFAMIDYALNTLLPLGFISNCSGNGYDFDIEALINKIYNIADSFDIAGLLSLIGRNTAATDSCAPNGVKMGNILNNTNVIKQILDLAQRILYLVAGTNLLPATTNCATLLTSANIGTLASNLLEALNNRSGDLLNNLLPVVIVFFPEFAGEQEMGTPAISLNNKIVTNSGSLSGATFTIANGSKGVWRHGYLQDGTEYQDNQYSYEVKGVKVYNIDGSVCSNVTIASYPTAKLDFGQSGTVTYNVSSIPTNGKVVRFEVSYIVYNEEGQAMSNGKVFTTNSYIYFSYAGSNERINTTKKWEGSGDNYSKYSYITDFYVPASKPVEFFGDGLEYAKYDKSKTGISNRAYGVVCNTGAKQGITLDAGNHGSQSGAVDEVTLYAKVTNANALKAYAEDNKDEANSLTFGITGYDNDATGGRSHNIVFHFYNDVYRNKLNSLVDSELSKMRLAEDYNTTKDDGVVYAGTVLETAANEEGLVETNFTTTGINPDGDPETQVTVIDCADAWSNYIAALNAAAPVGRQYWNGNASYNFEELYKDLYTASKDVNYLKKTQEQVVAEGGGDSIDGMVADLAATLEGYNTAMADFGEADYASWRWERYITARKTASNIVNAYNTQNYATPDDTFFPYNTSLDEATLGVVAGKTDYNDYILALREAYTAEQMEARVTALDNAKIKYASYTALDVEQAQNLLTRNYTRLLTKDINAELYFLNQEIDSAEVLYGEENGKKGTTYSDKSWNRYADALAAAKAEAAAGGNDSRFNAKYELQVAVNNLRTEENEASYEELEMLMAQAEYVLNNTAMYSNNDKEFGLVVAALGIDAETDAKGNLVQLFPDAARRVDEKSFAADDQKKVDRAADTLRAALANMTFADFEVKNAAVEAIGKDANDKDINLNVSHISPKLSEEDLYDLFPSDEDNDISWQLSNNGTYALIEFDDYDILVGTGATLTYFKEVAGVYVPLKTVTMVVDGDVNGDGAVDVLDVSLVELVSNDHASLDGVYKYAADLRDGDGKIDANDFGDVVNIALGDVA